jgi:hypothetical protein
MYNFFFIIFHKIFFSHWVFRFRCPYICSNFDCIPSYSHRIIILPSELMCKNPQCNCMLLFLHNPIFSTTTNCIGVHSISESTTQAVPVSHSPNQSPVIFSNVTSQKKLLITSTSPSLRMRYQHQDLQLHRYCRQWFLYILHNVNFYYSRILDL